MELEVLKEMAKKVGFDAVGVAPAALLSDEVEFLKKWLGDGKNADMAYMQKNLEVREDVGRLVNGAKSVIVTLTNYYHTWRQEKDIPQIAMYAHGLDYHRVVKDRLFCLWHEILKIYPHENARCFVDSAPILEHAWARRAGLGWQGKNTLLINKDLGSFCFIGVIVTTLAFDTYDAPFEGSYCGNCSRCINACPTGALSPGSVDARRCISYQTIENRGDYPLELKRLAGNRIFGCDACQEVCPWNRRLTSHVINDFLPSDGCMNLTEIDWREMTEERFNTLFKNSPLQRAGLEHLKRNLIDHVSL